MFRNCDIQYSQIYIYFIWYIRRINESLTWLSVSDRQLASRVGGHGSNPVSYTFYVIILFFIYFIIYLERKPTDPSRGFVSIS